MPSLHNTVQGRAQWPLPHELHGLLCITAGHHQAAQPAGHGHDGTCLTGGGTTRHIVHDGRRSPARYPDPGETPLSWSEVRFGIERGLLMVRSVTLPWPPRELSPNVRVHWATLSRAKKAYREACAWQAKAQGLRKVEAQALHVTLTFHAPSRRAYDLDNALARMKSGIDGLADVLGIDDSKWTLTIRKADTIGGMVVADFEVQG